MPVFSSYFQLGRTQRELDFVDVDTDQDTPVYVDPYAIEIRDDVWAAQASGHIRSLFLEVLTALRAGDTARATNLMSHFHEPRETFLGVSRHEPQGRGVGAVQSAQLVRAIRRSEAFTSGILADLSEMSLYVEKVDRDKISDLTTNIIRHLLADYTKQQCDLYAIPVSDYNGPPGWNASRNNWTSKTVLLPYVDGKPVLLVPKYIVRRRLSLDSQEFYNKQITDYLVAEHYRANSSLVQAIKGGKEQKVYKKDVRKANPKSKSLIADIVKKHPDILDTFKKIAKTTSSMATFRNDDPSLQRVCRSLVDALTAISPGTAAADEYHRLMMGALTVLFYPDLIQPHKEWEINGGRKRVDVVYTNAASDNFFAHRRDGNTQANVVIVECKNYSTDIGNEELDQLLGRFDNNRGRFGILTCRHIDKPATVLARCRDMAVRGTGFVIVLTDANILEMLEAKGNLRDEHIYEMLHAKYRELLQ
jgi:hypothetical protein